MSLETLGLITTLTLGLFIFLGAIIAFIVKDRSKIVEYSIGLAFGVIVTLIITDIFPEMFECFNLKNIYIPVIGVVLGFGILKILDCFIPDHEEEHMTKKELKDNLIHIGIITSIALVLHNIIEGMAVYSTMITANKDLALGMTLGVGCHNLPLGMVIASSLYQSNKSKKKTAISLIAVSLSTFLGGLILFAFKLNSINEILSGLLLAITLGMLLFITIEELLPRILQTKKKKTTYYGILTGIIILIIGLLI